MKSKMTFSYHEDFQHEIGIVDIENEFIAKWFFTSIPENELRNPFNEMDSETVHKRSSNLLTSAGLTITISEIERIFLSSGLDKIENVLTGYGGKYETPCENTIAFGSPGAAILVDFIEDLVTSIWLVGNMIQSEYMKEKIVKGLINISQNWNLLLVDDNKEIAIKISDSHALNQYFKTIKY